MYITTGSLSKDVKDPKTSIGRYLRTTFPDPRLLQVEYKALASDLIIDSLGANPSNVGTAVDLIISLVLEPDKPPPSALILYPILTTYHQVVTELASLVGHSGDPELAARAAWALAFSVSAHRAGVASAPLVPELVRSNDFTVDTMLEQAGDAAVAELVALRKLSEE